MSSETPKRCPCFLDSQCATPEEPEQLPIMHHGFPVVDDRGTESLTLNIAGKCDADGIVWVTSDRVHRTCSGSDHINCGRFARYLTKSSDSS